MKGVELYAKVRFAVRIEGISSREAARRFGIDPRTVAKMLLFSVPPGYRRNRPPARPKLDPFIGIIDRILQENRKRPVSPPSSVGLTRSAAFQRRCRVDPAGFEHRPFSMAATHRPAWPDGRRFGQEPGVGSLGDQSR